MKNKESRIGNTRRIAVSGIMAALSVAIVYIAAVTELFSYSGCLVATIIVLFLRVEYGMRTAAVVYASVSALLWMILPDKSIAAVYTFVTGIYPLVKIYFDKIKNKILRVAVKLLSFNADIGVLYAVAMALFAPEAESVLITVAMFVLANFTFIIVDFLFDRLTALYVVKYRQVLRRHGII